MTDPNLPPEPGTVTDLDHGMPGPAVPLPEDDHLHDEPTVINDDEDDD